MKNRLTLQFLLKVVVLPEFSICNTDFVLQPFSTKLGTNINNNIAKAHKSSKIKKNKFMLIYANFIFFGNAKIMKKGQLLCMILTSDSN